VPALKALGVIPARRGSRGLRDKNIWPLLGKPVVWYSIQHAREAGLLDRVVVSTDCPEVKEIARQEDVAVIDRPRRLATATARIDSVLVHAVEHLKRTEGFAPDIIVLLYANVPVRPAGLIDRAIRRLARTGADSVRSFTPVGKVHPMWLSMLDEDHRVTAYTQSQVYRRQDLPGLYYHDGGVVAVTSEALACVRHNPDDNFAFFGRDRRGLELKEGMVVEIDSLLDLCVAEAMLRVGSDEGSGRSRRAGGKEGGRG